MFKEKEIKILLNEEEYHRLAALFKWDVEFVQTNYYYGNNMLHYPDEMESTIRVREKNEKLVLQVKIPESKDNSLHVKKEYERQMSDIPEYISKDELSRMTGEKFINDVILLGKLLTIRKECYSFDDVVICLDKNSYLDKIDYEVEIEFTHEYPHEIVNGLEKNGIRTNRDAIGKYSRFAKRYCSRGGEKEC